MLDNPWQPIFHSFQRISNFIQTQLSSLTRQAIHPSSTSPMPFFFLTSPSNPKPSNGADISSKVTTSLPVTKEELGRATWTFLHTLAAQYPEHPTRQQKKDVKELMAILSRMYPCKECAEHFKEILRANPVHAGSQHEFSQWICHVHNVVNRSLGKPIFPSERVDARWGKLDCEQGLCDLQGNTTFKDDFR